MCLGVPGRIEAIDEGSPLRAGRVSFDGVTREVCLAAVPEAGVGDYVIVHAGFAISRLSAEDAAETLAWLERLEEPDEAPR